LQSGSKVSQISTYPIDLLLIRGSHLNLKCFRLPFLVAISFSILAFSRKTQGSIEAYRLDCIGICRTWRLTGPNWVACRTWSYPSHHITPYSRCKVEYNMGFFAPPFPKIIPKSHCMRTVDKQMQKCFCFLFAVKTFVIL